MMPIDLDECLAELTSRDLVPAGAHCVFVSGSLVRGWGNSTSDLDIYVISTGAWTGTPVETVPVRLQPAIVPVNAFFAGNRRWDVEYWQETQIEQLFGYVSWPAYDSGSLRTQPLGRHEVDVLEQLSYGRPLLGVEWLRAHQRRLADSALRTHLVSQRLNLADIYVEDAAGQLQSGDVECAVLSARIAFGHAVDALTARHGELGQNPKWRPKRLRAVDQPVLDFDDYWRVETMREYDPARPASWVRDVLERCRLIAVEVMP